MKVFIIGGCNTVVNALLQKFNKEGLKLYVLTGSHQYHNKYKHVYEQYHFSYENNCIKEVFESVRPDVTIFTGAFDSNYHWENGFREITSYCSGLYNILTAYSLLQYGRFIYLSSDEISRITEDEYTAITKQMAEPENSFHENYAAACKANALKNGEEICCNYKETTSLDILTLRINELCYLPKSADEADFCLSELCMEALTEKKVTLSKDLYMPFYLSDMTEFLCRLVKADDLKHHFYYMGADNGISANELCLQIDSCLALSTHREQNTGDETLWIDSRLPYNLADEVSCTCFYDAKACIQMLCKHIQKHKKQLIINKETTGTKHNVKKWLAHIFQAALPFIENMICFIPFFMINNRVTESAYFARLDCYLLYVLLFAIVYGQQQASFSAILSIGGYFFRQMYHRTGFEVALDYNTYVWIAQLMILGLSVGYLRDQLSSMKADKADEITYLNNRLKDIEEINAINTRLKNDLETQVVNQSDSIGKIFEITSSLDSDEPESVFFHAAEVVSQLMDCRDVAIYNVSNRNYARLMSSTSESARRLGNSIAYTEYTQMVEAFKNRTVFVNRQLTENVPLMAAAILSNDEIQSIIMLWDISWDRLNLSFMNRFQVIGYLIQNAVLRANRYIDVLEHERYINGTKILEPAAFRTLLKAFLHAQQKGLTDCSLIQITPKAEGIAHASRALERLFRNSDYLGSINDGFLYVLLANTSPKDAGYVTQRIAEAGYSYRLVTDIKD